MIEFEMNYEKILKLIFILGVKILIIISTRIELATYEMKIFNLHLLVLCRIGENDCFY